MVGDEWWYPGEVKSIYFIGWKNFFSIFKLVISDTKLGKENIAVSLILDLNLEQESEEPKI